MFTPNTDFYNNYFDKERYLLGYRISLIFTLVFGILSVLSYFYFKDIFLTHFITFITGLLCFIYILTTKNYKILFWAYSIVGTLVIIASMNFLPQITHFIDYIWALVIVLTAFVGINLRAGFIFLIFNSLNLLFFITFSMNQHLKAIKLRDSIDLNSEIIETFIALFVFGYLLYKFIEFQTFSEKEISKTYLELKEKNNYISSQNKENIALVKEVHHRVKNNLQIIISLLRLQSNELKTEETKTSLNEAINRIMVMSLIHQKLYGNESLSNINLKDYLIELIEDIKDVYNTKDIEINIQSNYNVGLKTIVPLGLLFNELITNTLKHAFKDDDCGKITVVIKQKVGRDFEVFYTDNGKWIEPTEDHTSFGLELIDIMTSQLEGHYEKVIDDNSTNYIFFLKDIDEEDKRKIKEQLGIKDSI
jgi:two-component sensor histidine kinase